MTPWNELREALITVRQIMDHFNGQIPDSVKNVLLSNSIDLHKFVSDYNQLTDLLYHTECIKYCNSLMNPNGDSNIADVKIDIVASWLQQSTQIIFNLYSKFDLFNSMLIDSTTQLSSDQIVIALRNVKRINEINKWIEDNQNSFKENLGTWNNKDSIKWDSINEAISNFKELVEFFGTHQLIPDLLQTTLLSDDNKLIPINELFNDLKNLFDQWEVCNERHSNMLTYSEGIRDINSSTIDKLEIKINLLSTIFESYNKVLSSRINIQNSSEYIEFLDVIRTVVDIRKIEDYFELLNPELAIKYANRFRLFDTDWPEIAKTIRWILALRQKFNKDDLPKQFVQALCEVTGSVETITNWRSQLGECYLSITTEIEYIQNLFEDQKFDFDKAKLSQIADWLVDCLANFEALEDWIDFRDSKIKCLDLGLANFINEIIEKEIPSEYLPGAFNKRFYTLWLDDTYSKVNAIKSFRGINHEDIIRDFQALDKSQFRIAQSRIREFLSAKRPNPNDLTSRGSQISILQREMNKKRRHLPLRKLFVRIPTLLFTLKPCLLMSPLSVSLFLDPEHHKFDVVIFDEASQICSENAIGAIFRAEQCIIVGDKEQLPPTNFFNASTGEEEFDTDDYDEENDIDAYESILDECSTALNQLTLLWHYRSRHEHLITFSNTKIYKNLITFPSSVNKMKDFGVEYVEVADGVYDRAGTRTNRVEARQVAQLIFQHFHNYPDRSLGVVAFSEAQQNAIDAEVRNLRLKNPQFETFFIEDKQEPFFIKNLENVQGDERDTIIFSIGYAKDKNGKMNMNFGPLSKQGGYRRLNVAITRARDNIKLVGSIKPTDIDTERTTSRGVIMLRQYIDFAINGEEALLNELEIPNFADFDSPFEQEVYSRITDLGYKVDTQVGCSGYRIDLAVRHPELSGIYIMGIECDGASYHSARTARERDRLREEALKARGWNIYRIWSTDWIKNPTEQIKRLITAIDNALKEFSYSDTLANLNTDTESNALTSNILGLNIETTIEHENSMIDNYGFEEYIIADINEPNRTAHMNDYQYVAAVINHIVKIECPIHIDLLAKRIAPLFGREKVTVVLKRYIYYVLETHCQQIRQTGNFLWHNDLTYPRVRIPGNGEIRIIEHICSDEICQAMKEIVKKSIGIDINSLCTETARVFGFKKNGAKIKEAMLEAIIFLVDSDELKNQNDILTIANRPN